jgi:hypothetical protein
VGERSATYAEFAARFATDRMEGPARACDLSAIEQIEEALETFLPCSYRMFLHTCGPLFVPDLWDEIVRRELGAWPVREFFDPEGVVNDTRLAWSGGMPRDVVGIASDFAGNLFGFRRAARVLPRLDQPVVLFDPDYGQVTAGFLPRPDDCPALVFDHDYGRVIEVAVSFDGWLNWFMEHV